jgi:hypothetical protein
MSDLANEADMLNDAIADDAPVMPNALTGEVKLLRGLYDKDQDVWHDVAFVRELTGQDEERLATIGSREDIGYSEYMSEVLKLAVERIGDIDIKRLPGAVDKLILADRDMLFLGITRRTYGVTKEFRIRCGHCGTQNDVEVSLDDDFLILKPDGFDPKEPLKVKTSKGIVEMRLPTGETSTIAADKGKTDAEINTYLLGAGVLAEDIVELEEGVAWARSLNLGDRKKLVTALTDLELGPKMGEVETQCSECGKDVTVLLDWVSLLLA